ncbi:MAG: XRE family transcriptional regulator [Pyrinomonadaceae bacterium]
MQRVELDINPSVLRWAREEAGFNPEEAAKKASTTPETYLEWESRGSRIPLGKLSSLASAYKRQIAVFFLPEAPPKLQRPTDFRNLTPAKSKLSKKVLQVIRDVTYFRQVARELRTESIWQANYDWLKQADRRQFSDDQIAESLRDRLNITVEDQFGWQSDNEAYRKWRNAVETRLGILVFQFPMSMDEAQGFGFSDTYPYAIVTNSNHSYTGRTFTIFHELAHIIRHHSAICLIDRVGEKQQEEWACNLFAGRFLVPDSLVEEADDLKTIQTFASRLNVSREVYLRRLKELGKITDRHFFDLLAKLKASYNPTKKKGGYVAPEVKSRASRGNTFYDLVLEAVHNEQLSYSRASSVLNLSVPRILREV